LLVDTSDRELIVRARERDIAAFSMLVERRWNGLVRFARSIVGEAEAEDVVQDGLIKAWRKLPGLRTPEAFTAWSLRIVARLGFRRARRRQLVPLIEASGTRDARSIARLQAIDVEMVLAMLPPRQRAVMHLTVIEGMTDTEIAAALAITAAAVRSHRRRARMTLSRVFPAPAAAERVTR
jgi:RNA polymerase sigma-70 factor (ECF subfamily)